MDWKRYKKAMLVLTVILSLVLVSIGGVFSPLTIAKDREIGPNEVQGKVLFIETNAFRRGTIEVKSDQTNKTYTFYVGSRTAYYPHRYPTIGETIKVFYINDQGYLKATQVEIVKSLP
ncbi:MAG: hypothetical protein A2Y65_07465 [Deltaproteobacteria bacterium RBG_13_52_11]|jgi:hypothetical protein|nr:MAG: hypothetical protein A2Y65_07465 [Deltaproteobacteria bacterium RBG_13_52_11]